MSNIYNWYKVENYLYRKGIPLLPKIIKFIMRILFTAVIPYETEIGEGTRFGYAAMAIVIHKKAVIGKNCVISQGVTIGGTSHKEKLPILGNNVYVGAGAKIIGDIKVGNNVVIGSNSVVVKDVPDNCLVVGVPGRIIKKNIDINDYI